MTTQLIPLPPTPTKTRTVLQTRVVGQNVGGRHVINTIADLNAVSPSVEIAVRGIDVNPNNLMRTAVEAAHRGLSYEPFNLRGEDLIQREAASPDQPIILATDDPRANARICAAAAAAGCAVLCYLMIRLPSKRLVGLTAVLPRDAAEEKLALALFLAGLADVTARRGSRAVLGEMGLPEHAFLEPHFRLLFKEHLATNLSKVLFNLDPEAAPIEVSFDGEARMPLIVTDSRRGWRTPDVLARDIVERPSVALEPGKDLSIGEVGPEGIRLHVARLRTLDGAISVNETTVVDAAAFEQALRRAERQTVTKTNPAWTTD
jgi:hypothetical protein